MVDRHNWSVTLRQGNAPGRAEQCSRCARWSRLARRPVLRCCQRATPGSGTWRVSPWRLTLEPTPSRSGTRSWKTAPARVCPDCWDRDALRWRIVLSCYRCSRTDAPFDHSARGRCFTHRGVTPGQIVEGVTLRHCRRSPPHSRHGHRDPTKLPKVPQQGSDRCASRAGQDPPPGHAIPDQRGDAGPPLQEVLQLASDES